MNLRSITQQLDWTGLSPRNRFMLYADISSKTECWEWRGPRRYEYGCFSYSNNLVQAHRFSYELFIGPIPDGLVIDHLCRNANCVNPLHLEPVTIRENTLRGTAPAARLSKQTHCIHGHEFTPENTYIWSGMRQCKECSRNRKKEYAVRHAENTLCVKTCPKCDHQFTQHWKLQRFCSDECKVKWFNLLRRVSAEERVILQMKGRVP